MAEHMAGLATLFETSEAGRSLMDDRVARLADAVEKLASRTEADGEVVAMLSRIAETQARMVEILENQGRGEGGVAGADVESRMRLRSMDVQLLRILEEMSAGRQESIADLRSDLAQLTRAVRQIGKDTPPVTARRSG
jgi:hypothetical protein